MICKSFPAQALVSSTVKTVELSERQACDVFCLVNGAFSPLTGFMDEAQYNAVVSSMRLPEKQLFGLPVTLDMNDVSGISCVRFAVGVGQIV